MADNVLSIQLLRQESVPLEFIEYLPLLLGETINRLGLVDRVAVLPFTPSGNFPDVQAYRHDPLSTDGLDLSSLETILTRARSQRLHPQLKLGEADATAITTALKERLGQVTIRTPRPFVLINDALDEVGGQPVQSVTRPGRAVVISIHQLRYYSQQGREQRIRDFGLMAAQELAHFLGAPNYDRIKEMTSDGDCTNACVLNLPAIAAETHDRTPSIIQHRPICDRCCEDMFLFLSELCH